MKKKPLIKKIFKTTEEMDQYLENNDLGEIFRDHGVWKKGMLRKINLDLPPAVVEKIDRIAAKIGVSRQPLLKMWIHERLKQEEIESSRNAV